MRGLSEKSASMAKYAKGNLPYNEILQGDSIEKMKELPDASIDMIFADPPYNLQLSKQNLCRPDHSIVNGVRDEWDQFQDFAAYDDFTMQWLSEAKRLLKHDGGLWVIGSYHNIFRLGAILQNLGFWIMNDVIWVKSNPMPNFRGTRFTNAHETLIWAAKSEKSQPKFHYEAMKSLNEGKQMRSDWFLPLCTGAERIKNKEGKKAHPTQKPEALLHRVIVASSEPGDVILDPFAGSGTTAAVAKKLGRRYIMIERDDDYIGVIKKRLSKINTHQDKEAIGHTTPKSKEPRIPFGTLIEHGLLTPGDELLSPCQQYRARVRADGSLISKEIKGSIHQVGARLQGTPSCNGWTYWMVETDHKPMPIDVLRQKLREDLYAV